ncbi:hypothetical protein VM98_38060, partial [Streptomyces rubellomurinus subsp. indigoferus]
APVVELAPPAPPATPVIGIDWTVATAAVAAYARFCEVVASGTAESDATVAAISGRIAPGDLAGVRAAARTAVAEGEVLAARVRVLGRDGHPYPVELWARVPSAI